MDDEENIDIVNEGAVDNEERQGQPLYAAHSTVGSIHMP